MIYGKDVKIIWKFFFRLKERLNHFISIIRNLFYQIQGMTIGKGTYIPKILITWPHQASIGQGCILEEDIYFKFDGICLPGPSIVIGNNVFIGRGCEFNIRQGIKIGDDCLIASGCKFIDHDHDLVSSDEPMRKLGGGIEKSINIENNAWLGTNVLVLKGVTIGKGAVIGAGAVVTKSIPPNEIWSGVPASKKRDRKKLVD
jgi:acetyltransferase-like isoleucine patch superfamily enzyme